MPNAECLYNNQMVNTLQIKKLYRLILFNYELQ